MIEIFEKGDKVYFASNDAMLSGTVIRVLDDLPGYETQYVIEYYGIIDYMLFIVPHFKVSATPEMRETNESRRNESTKTARRVSPVKKV